MTNEVWPTINLILVVKTAGPFQIFKRHLKLISKKRLRRGSKARTLTGFKSTSLKFSTSDIGHCTSNVKVGKS